MNVEEIIAELSKHHKIIKEVEQGIITKSWVTLFNEKFRVPDYNREIGMAMVDKHLVAYSKSWYDDGLKSDKVYKDNPVDMYARLVKIKNMYEVKND